VFRGLFKLLVLCVLALAIWVAFAVMVPMQPRADTFVLLHPGWSTRRIARELKSAGVIRSTNAFLLVHYFEEFTNKDRRTLKAGEYKFDHAANVIDVRNRLARGDIYTHTVVVPEGYNIFDIARAIEEAGLGSASDFLKVAHTDSTLIHDLDPQARTLEGYLFPDTYQFSRTQSLHDIAGAMVRRFQQEARGLGLNENVHEIVTMASIVEKETSVPDERPIVASVYFNRLQKHIALAADPSVVYAALLDGRYRGTIYQSDLQASSPYNTYKFPGLPPGPIANPGRASLLAAMHPATTDYLYFVADGSTGHHRFASSYEAHQRNVAAYRHAMNETR